MNRQNIKYIGHFFLIVGIQVLVLNHININGLINPYLYPLLIILLPLNIRPYALLLIAFFTGITIDCFEHSYGMHASVLVLVAFLRPLLFKILNPKEQENDDLIDMYYHGVTWFVVYISIMVFLHHLIYFVVEKGNFSAYHFTFIKTIISSIFSVLCMMMYLLFASNKSSTKYN